LILLTTHCNSLGAFSCHRDLCACSSFHDLNAGYNDLSAIITSIYVIKTYQYTQVPAW